MTPTDPALTVPLPGSSPCNGSASAPQGSEEGLSSGESTTKQKRLDRHYQDALKQLGNISDEFRKRVYEDLRLQVEYPTQYVAFVDEWKNAIGTGRQLVRQVLCHGLELVQVLDAMQSLDPNSKLDWLVLYIPDPDSTDVMM